MIIQLDRLNELLQRKIESTLKERHLNEEDVEISVNGSKIEIKIIATGEMLKL